MSENKGIIESMQKTLFQHTQLLTEILEAINNGQSASVTVMDTAVDNRTMTQLMEDAEKSTPEQKAVAAQQAKEIIAQQQTLPVSTPEVELDAQGCPWDERINTNNHGKTQKDIFKKKPGLDAAYYDQVVAELQAKYANQKYANQVVTPPPVVSAPIPAAEPVTPSVPAAPVAAPTPAAPTVPPSAPVTEVVNIKAELAKQVNEINTTYEVPADKISTELSRFGADTIDKIPAEKYEELNEHLSHWLDGLEACQSVIDDIEKLDAQYPDKCIKNGVAGWVSSVAKNGATEFPSAPVGTLAAIAETLTEQWLKPWKANLSAA